MLWLCLDYLSACTGRSNLSIWVFVDAHQQEMAPPRREIELVLDKFPHLPIHVEFRSPHMFHGNSFNVLMAFREAYQTTAEHVFLIEDDVLIQPDFFKWHRLQHTRVIGCSIGIVKKAHHGSYASLGVCFRRETISRVLPHCQQDYFANMRKYCRAMFPFSRLDCEQDGLWARVLTGLPVVWARVPLAHHVGWYGYHRKTSVRPYGALEDRYFQVKKVLSSMEELRQRTRNFKDIAPIENCN